MEEALSRLPTVRAANGVYRLFDDEAERDYGRKDFLSGSQPWIEIARVTGFVNTPHSAFVRGHITLSPQYDLSGESLLPQLELVIEAWQGAWTTVRRVDIDRTLQRRTVEVETFVSGNSDPRMVVRALRSGMHRSLVVHSVRLFGAQCYPDFANPGSCLM